MEEITGVSSEIRKIFYLTRVSRTVVSVDDLEDECGALVE
jgi:hypothetical protein